MDRPEMPSRSDFEFNFQYEKARAKWSTDLIKYIGMDNADVLSPEEKLLEYHVDEIKRLPTLEAMGYLKQLYDMWK